MKTQNQHLHALPSLSVQITQAERQVLDRRRQIGDRARLLDRAIRVKFSSIISAALLLVGGSIGVTAGYFSKPPASAQRNNVSPRLFSLNALLDKTLRLIAFARLVHRIFLPVQHGFQRRAGDG